MEPMTGFEPVTSSLPRKHSTTELHRPTESGRRASNSRPTAWKAVALPTELLPQVIDWFFCSNWALAYVFCCISFQDNRRACKACRASIQWVNGCGERRIRTFEAIKQRIYSPPHLAALESPLWCLGCNGSSCYTLCYGMQIYLFFIGVKSNVCL